MRKELDFFQIEGGYGGNQDWFYDPLMRLGGCGALTAMDVSIYLAKFHQMRHLCPVNLADLNKKTYLAFSKIMKPYLRPRSMGINKLSIYIEGFDAYLKDRGETGLALAPFDGAKPVEEAFSKVKERIDRSMPVPFLLLKHKDPGLEDFVWHWFLLTGYEEFEDTWMVKTLTYGEYLWMDFRRLWDSGYIEKGGLILLKPPQETSK